mgnify:CR=1 FL=1
MKNTLKNKKILFVAGGVGTAPVYPQVKWLHEHGVAADVIVGAKTKDLVILEKEMEAVAGNYYPCTDDGTYGHAGMVTSKIEKLIEEGKTFEEVVSISEERKHHMCQFFTVDDLTYLKKGGRISKTVAFAGAVLNIKPVLSVVDGEICLLGKARGSKMGNNLLVQEINKAGGIDFNKPLLLGYTGISDALLVKYIKDSHHLWEENLEKVPYTTVGSAIGTHVGPGAVAVAFFKK